MALVSADSIIWIGCFGYADLESGKPVTENTHFRIGSCTKSFTGLAFLKLMDEGRIDINMPIRDIIPETKIDNPWRDNHPVRVIHLLEHTSGFDDSHLNWFYFKGPAKTLKEALDEKANLRRVRWPPGTRFSYSSPGFTLAGYIMEKVSGRPFEDYIEQNILEPIGMKTATIGRADDNRQLLATGYGNNNERISYYYDYDEPAGAMNSSIKEMALFVQFMLRRGIAQNIQIIEEESLARVGRPSTTIAAQKGIKAGYSFGISSGFHGNLQWYGHAGAVPGFYADYTYYPQCGLGYVVLLNEFGTIYYNGIFELIEEYLLCDIAIDSAPFVEILENMYRKYCGYYEYRSSRISLMEFADMLFGGRTILFENDTLYQQDFMGAKTPLAPVSECLFKKPNQPMATIAFAESGNGKMIYATNSSYYEKAASWKPIVYRSLFFGALIIMSSAVVYALIWIPIHLYKRAKGRDNRSKYLRMRIIPLLAVLSLILGFAVLINQNLLELGQMTVRNVIFFSSTLLFAAFSIISGLTALASFRKPVKNIARIYSLILSAACIGMTLFLGFWGIIGLRLWAY